MMALDYLKFGLLMVWLWSFGGLALVIWDEASIYAAEREGR